MYIYKNRKITLESDIEIKINFIGNGIFKIKTFIFFFDHLFIQFINYSMFDCYLRCYSDLKTDTHHIIEDIGIILGNIMKMKKFTRYNSFFMCMDDSFILMSIDISNRNYYFDNVNFFNQDFFLIREFLFSFSKKFNCNLYLYIINYKNIHHLLESIFKVFGIIFNITKNKAFNSTKGII